MEEINIFIAGDFCPIGRNEQNFMKGDFSAVKEITQEIEKADYAVVNLEAPLTNGLKTIQKSGPNIKAAPETVNALRFLGIDLVTLANNHILDSGHDGVIDTINICKENNIAVVGAGESLEQARRAHFVTLKNKKFAFLNFAENEFCAATETSAGANPIDEISNFQDIRQARATADYVIVIVHGGREHYQLPVPKQRDRFRFYADVGADLVVGHHTHCFSGYEVYNDIPIFYSLGNFVFDYKRKYQKGKWTEGYAVMFNFGDNISFQLIPFKQGLEQDPALHLLHDAEKDLFCKTVESLNKIIKDDHAFKEKWEEYLKTQELSYLSMLTVQNKYVRAAINKNLVPYVSFHSEEHLLLLLNLMRCETHREIMTAVLSQKFEDER